MVFRKFAKRNYRRYGGKGKGMKRIKQVIRREIDRNTENKESVFDMSSQFGSISNSWTELSLCNPAQGNQNNQRIGSVIRIKSIEIKGVVAAGSSESLVDDPYDAMRVVLGLYSMGSVTPLATAGYNINSIIRTDISNVRGLLRKKYYDRYIPLEVTSVEKNNGDGYAPALKTFRYYKKFPKGITVRYNDNTTNYPNNQLILSMISNSSAVPNPGFVVGYVCVSYEDA